MSQNGEEKESLGLTHDENKAIIAEFANRETELSEQKATRSVFRVQVLMTLFAGVVLYLLKQNVQLTLAVLCGGGASIINSFLLVWRMRRSSTQVTLDAHVQLRLLFYYAAERFAVVVMLLAVGLMVLKLPPLYLLGGFMVGQVALLATRLVLTRSK